MDEYILQQASMQPLLKTTQANNDLIIEIHNPHTNQNYQLLLSSLNNKKQLSQGFDSLQDLALHLKNENHYHIDFQARKLEVLGKHPTRNSLFLHIVDLQFTKKEEKMGKDQLVENVVGKCRGEDNLSNQDMKVVILHLLERVKELENRNVEDDSKSQISNIPEYRSQIRSEGQDSKRESSTIQQLQKQLKEKDEVIEAIIRKIKNYSDQFDQRMGKLQDRVENLEKKLITVAAEKEEAEKRQVRVNNARELAVDFVDETCYSFPRLFVRDSVVVKYLDEEADVFSKIPLRTKNTFSLRIEKLNDRMCIGIVDSKLKTRQSFVNEPNCVVYYTDGNFYNGKSLRGRIFRPILKGDTVTVTVDFVQGKIQWKVGAQQRIAFDFDRVRDESIRWVPYIWIIDNGDGFSVLP